MNDNKTDLLKPSDFAKKYFSKSNRTLVYYLIDQNKIDTQIIAGVKFVVMSERTLNFMRDYK